MYLYNISNVGVHFYHDFYPLIKLSSIQPFRVDKR